MPDNKTYIMRWHKNDVIKYDREKYNPYANEYNVKVRWIESNNQLKLFGRAYKC